MNTTKIILLFVVCLSAYLIMQSMGGALPRVELPKIMQHNNLGELPIVEMADDGVFAEEDGAEYEYTSMWCDEIKGAFTCSLKFGQSYSVARRIAKNELLDSCEEARKAAQDELSFCIEQQNSYRALPDSVNFYNDWYQDGVKSCYDEHLYIPECDDDYNFWVKSRNLRR